MYQALNGVLNLLLLVSIAWLVGLSLFAPVDTRWHMLPIVPVVALCLWNFAWVCFGPEYWGKPRERFFFGIYIAGHVASTLWLYLSATRISSALFG